MMAILEFSQRDAMKKNDRMAAFVKSLGCAGDGTLDRCYLGYFQCFNEQRYYEAHDVLEHLWLQDRETKGPDYLFFKGLIQFAGAFVHLRKQSLRPGHPTDGRRLRPAARLFRLAMRNLAPYRPVHLSLDVAALHHFCEAQAGAIEASEYTVNPWSPEKAPVLRLIR